jgi:hypothetical protein
VRLDIGFRVTHTPHNTQEEVAIYGAPPGTLFGIPAAVAIGLGEAY